MFVLFISVITKAVHIYLVDNNCNDLSHYKYIMHGEYSKIHCILSIQYMYEIGLLRKKFNGNDINLGRL